MAFSFMDAIGALGKVLTVLSFAKANMPSNAPQGASIQIKYGLGNASSSGMGGHVDAIYAFDYNNNYLGTSQGCSEPAGGVCTKTIDQINPGVESDFISIANGNDASCLSWVAVSMNDNSPGGAWTGDVGQQCGQKWYYGFQVAGHYPDGSDWRPACTWLDGDHTDGIANAAFKFAVRAYGDLSNQTVANDAACSSTIWGPDDAPIGDVPGNPPRAQHSPPASAPAPRITWMEKRLIVSKLAGHTAQYLCESETNYGPDLVGVDDMFCDMSAKLLLPLCSPGGATDCVEVDMESQIVTIKESFGRHSAKKSSKSYDIVSEWIV